MACFLDREAKVGSESEYETDGSLEEVMEVEEAAPSQALPLKKRRGSTTGRAGRSVPRKGRRGRPSVSPDAAPHHLQEDVEELPDAAQQRRGQTKRSGGSGEDPHHERGRPAGRAVRVFLLRVGVLFLAEVGTQVVEGIDVRRARLAPRWSQGYRSQSHGRGGGAGGVGRGVS
nr:hypothetical protein [Tawny frogmouth aviadenovirus A]